MATPTIYSSRGYSASTTTSPSPRRSSPSLLVLRLRDRNSKSDSRPSTPDTSTPALAPAPAQAPARGQLEPGEIIWFNPRKEITKAILEVIRRLYGQLYLTWGEILFLLRQDMLNEFKHSVVAGYSIAFCLGRWTAEIAAACLINNLKLDKLNVPWLGLSKLICHLLMFPIWTLYNMYAF
ncbi:hypothetical protein RND71_039685 [Anisodus tanguticus]|uniref:Uncharacterized protein n=1 Tax=Anisodus tanguticus TaxID=243964 RepID=A0AAE1UXU1_9SOLA|nr:hypothetical protein RND71_039685 [Anisodus tanguticus]